MSLPPRIVRIQNKTASQISFAGGDGIPRFTVDPFPRPTSTIEVDLYVVQFDEKLVDSMVDYFQRGSILVWLESRLLNAGEIRDLKYRGDIEGTVTPHDLVGSKHYVSGLTAGTVLTATSPTTFGFQPPTPIYTAATPPGSPSNADLWFNTNLMMLMYYDSTRGKWLSVDSIFLNWAHDTADNNALRGFGLQAAGAGTGLLVYGNFTVVAASARARGGNLTKDFELRDGATVKHSFNLSAGIYNNSTINVDLNQGDDIWVYAGATGVAAQDATVGYLLRRRVAP